MANGTRRIDAVEFVFFLELADFALQSFLRETQRIDQLFQFSHAADHPGAVDDQFADRIHHAVEAVERDANRLGGCAAELRTGLECFRAQPRSPATCLRRARFRDSPRLRSRGDGFFDFDRSKFRDATQQGIDACAHFGFVGPLLVQSFLQYIDRFEANIHDRGRRFDFSVAQPADQIFNAMCDRRQAASVRLALRNL